jgi:hypothetical protein
MCAPKKRHPRGAAEPFDSVAAMRALRAKYDGLVKQVHSPPPALVAPLSPPPSPWSVSGRVSPVIAQRMQKQKAAPPAEPPVVVIQSSPRMDPTAVMQKVRDANPALFRTPPKKRPRHGEAAPIAVQRELPTRQSDTARRDYQRPKGQRQNSVSRPPPPPPPQQSLGSGSRSPLTTDLSRVRIFKAARGGSVEVPADPNPPRVLLYEGSEYSDGPVGGERGVRESPGVERVRHHRHHHPRTKVQAELTSSIERPETPIALRLAGGEGAAGGAVFEVARPRPGLKIEPVGGFECQDGEPSPRVTALAVSPEVVHAAEAAQYSSEPSPSDESPRWRRSRTVPRRDQSVTIEIVRDFGLFSSSPP